MVSLPFSVVPLAGIRADLYEGFAVVGDYEDPTIKTAQSTAFEQMLKWLKDH